MAWIITNSDKIGYQPIATTETTKKHPLGTICQGYDATNGGAEFIYLQGVASTAVGSWVTYLMDGGTTALLAADAIGPVAIAMSANVANQYGWYQISGKAVGLCLASFVDNANVYATATAGSIDDAIVAGDRVKRAKGASARDTDTGAADFEIDRPFMDDALAA